MVQFAFSMNIFANISKPTFEDMTGSCPKIFNCYIYALQNISVVMT